MEKRLFTKLIVVMTTIVMTVGFVMSCRICVNASETTNVVVTLLKGKEINEIVKTLAGDSLPADKSITSLYLVKDITITGFERTSKVDENVSTVKITSDGDAVAWLSGTVVKWYSSADTVYLNADCSYMFYGLTNLQSIDDLDTVKSSRVENASFMMAGDTAITTLDLTCLTTDQITNMKAMFAGMSKLSSLNINNFETKNVTDMSEMFYGDDALSSLDLSSFTVSTSAITDTNSEPSYQSIISLRNPSATTTQTTETNITDMFSGSGLTQIEVSNSWQADISKDTKMLRVFATWMTQTLTMASNMQLKDISFTYSLTPGTAIAAAEGKTEVLAGKVNSNCVVTSASFSNSDTFINGTPNDANFEGKKYISKKVKIIIDATLLTEPGVYRYVVNQTTDLQGVDAGLFQLDPTSIRVLDVFTEYSDGKNLVVSASVMHKTQVELQGNTISVNDKSSQLDNVYVLSTSDLVVRNAVSGNQSDMFHTFKYTFVVNDDIAGRVLSVTHKDGTTEYITIDQNKHAEFEFELSGTQKITIHGIQKDANYTVTEDQETVEKQGYVTSVTHSNPEASYSPAVVYSGLKEETCYVSNSSVSEDVDVTFTNAKDGIVPTGVMINTAPYALSVFVGVSGIFLVHKKRKIEQSNE